MVLVNLPSFIFNYACLTKNSKLQKCRLLVNGFLASFAAGSFNLPKC